MSEADSLRAQLAAPGLSLARTIATVDAIEREYGDTRRHSLGISANVSIDLLSTFLRKHALLAGARVEAVAGQHDDLLGDVERFIDAGVDEMVYLPFFDNLQTSFEQQIEFLPPAELDAQESDLRGRWRLALEKARPLRRVYVCGLHRYSAPIDTGHADPVEETLSRLDRALREECATFANVRIIDTGAILVNIGAAAAFDHRFYLRSTAPYTPAFFDELARRIVASSRGFGSYFHKALVLDCDNTLWGGVVGEDLLEGIRLDPHSYPGKAYWQAQRQFLSLERQGILLCLCSKNNPGDVDEVLDKHPFSVLRREHLALRMVNWRDKVSNLRAIAEELNIGLDSLVFIDDSDFECAAVRSALPMVRVFQVPKVLTEYAPMLAKVRELFLAGGVAAESRSKTAQYRQRQEAAEARAQFATHEEYLASLGLEVILARDDAAQRARISELTMKSNQFNLTTLRQTPAEIEQRMSSASDTVYSLTVNDRFGSAGLTGVALLRWDGDSARVDSFLMSCRVIGRGVEFSVWPHIVEDARRHGCRRIEAEYRPTAKNAQVADFYERLGLRLVSDDNGVKRYRSELDEFNPPRTDWIKVNEH